MASEPSLGSAGEYSAKILLLACCTRRALSCRRNLTGDTAFDTMEYDVEGHQVQYTSGANVATYAYDGEGRRVSKTLQGSAASTTTYVYDARGMLAAEYSTAPPGDTGTTYLLTDHKDEPALVMPEPVILDQRHSDDGAHFKEA